MAKEILAGFAGAEADRLFETKGENWYDNRKMHKEEFLEHSKRQVRQLYDERNPQEDDGRY